VTGQIFAVDGGFTDTAQVVIDQFLAAKAFPGQSAIGRHILIRIRTPEAEKVQIIGGDTVFLQIAKAKVCVNLHCMTLLKGKPRIADLDLPGKVVAVGAAEPLVNGDFRRQRDLRMGERR
jgi:hypothetical protein